MNMLLHDVRYENFDIQNDDTLENPAFESEKFDAVVAGNDRIEFFTFKGWVF